MKVSKRVAIYARFSSSLQNPKSIDDQIALCERRIRETGGTVVATFKDAGMSGASMHLRKGLIDLLTAVEEGTIDVVWAEALDRLSRDQADMVQIYRLLQYHNVGLCTHEEGEVSDLHVSLKSVINETFRTSLSQKVRRGKLGAAMRGRVPGRNCYGYRVLPRLPNEPGGKREIVPEEAETVRRIFRMYVDGTAPGDIARILNEDGVPGPKGGEWCEKGISGWKKRGIGILHNKLYGGILVCGRTRRFPDPKAGRSRPRPVPESEWAVRKVPHLQIVDDELWEQAQLRGRAGSDRSRSGGNRVPHPLTAVLACAACGGSVRVHRGRGYTCKRRHDRRGCDNRMRIDVRRTEDRALRELIRWVEAWREGSALLASATREYEQRRSRLEAEIEGGKEKIALLVESIERGGKEPRAVARRIGDLERSVAALTIELKSMRRPEERPAADLLRTLKSVLEGFAAAAANDETRRDALLKFRDLVERIDVSPTAERGEFEVTVRPRVDALVALVLE